jgi:hypothetical protein
MHILSTYTRIAITFGIVLSFSTWILLPGEAVSVDSLDPLGQGGCQYGTVVGGPNLITNGDFANGSEGFTSDLLNRGDGVYPDDGGGGGYSIQTGSVVYAGGVVVGRSFPGDQQREVPATETYFYSNPPWTVEQVGQGYITLWRQSVNNLTANTTYNFFAYFDNLLVPPSDDADPVIELVVDGEVAGEPIVLPAQPDQWVPVQFSFVTGSNQTEAVLEIRDRAKDYVGDDFGMTQVSLKQCVTGLGAAKFATAPVDNQNGTFTVRYIITVKNLGSDAEPLRELQISDDLATAFAQANAFEVLEVSSDTLTINTNFDGVADSELLTGTDTLSAGQRARVELTVQITPGVSPESFGPFENSAVASARAGSVRVEDRSVPGEDPDPDNDGDPGSDVEEVPTIINLAVKPLYLPMVIR